MYPFIFRQCDYNMGLDCDVANCPETTPYTGKWSVAGSEFVRTVAMLPAVISNRRCERRNACVYMLSQKQQNASRHYGVVIQVHDLTQVKAFYRDVLKLTGPTVDSTFWVEFALPGNGIVALEKCENVVPTARKREISWVLHVDDFEEKVKDLRDRNVPEVRPSLDIPGKRCHTFADPEGNPFTVYADVPDAE